MLRVGLTGGLGSGKSTVAAMLRQMGAKTIEADALGRALMEPGKPVYDRILRAFGPEIVSPSGALDRSRLAELAFQGGRLNQLNAIVHPAVVRAQRDWMDSVFAEDSTAVAVVESALIFEVERDARARGDCESILSGWKKRFDRLIVVSAPDDLKIARFVARTGRAGPARATAEAEVRARLAHQIPDRDKASRADYNIENAGDLRALEIQAQRIWKQLKAESSNAPPALPLE